MRRLPCISAVLLLSGTAMSAACGAQEKGLSGNRIPTDNGVLVIHPVRHATFLVQWNGKTRLKVLANGEKTEAQGIAVEAVPAYNTTPGKHKEPRPCPTIPLRP